MTAFNSIPRALARHWREILLVALLLVALEIVVFLDYFTGAVVPGGDFIGAYNFEAYAWWHDGSFFDPTQWMPYLWGGYPAVSNFQNSSYYLPVGIASAFGPFTLHASAVLSALHVGAGALGAYVFARAWGFRIPAASIALVAWFFAIGFYSNAAHLDIMRAYTWVPWVMLVASVKWPWRRWWAGPVAVLIVWQAALAFYPGMLVASVYALAVWVVAQAVLFRPPFTRFLLPAAIAAVAGIAMTLLRFLPALATRGTYPFDNPDVSEFGLLNLGSFLYSYDQPEFDGFTQFMSYFLPAAVLVAIAFVKWRSRLTIALVATVATTVVIGLPLGPWSDWLQEHLPGLDLSRFRASDFKAVMLFALVLLAASGVDRLVRGILEPAGEGVGLWQRMRPLRIPAILLLVLLAAFAVIAQLREFGTTTIVQWLLLLGATALALALALLAHRRGLGTGIVAALGVITVVSGMLGIYSVPATWRGDRLALEEGQIGFTVDSLIASREDDSNLVRREARKPPQPIDEPQQNLATEYSRSFYNGEPSVYGYVNLRGTETFEMVRASLAREGQELLDARAFWSAAGMVVENGTGFLPSDSEISTCVTTGECGGHLTVTPIAYDSPASFDYEVTATTDTPVSFNEAHYAGWQARVCPADSGTADDCVGVGTLRGEAGEVKAVIPEGHWNLHLEYELPHMTKSWIAFWAGVALAIGLGAAGPMLSRRGRRAN